MVNVLVDVDENEQTELIDWVTVVVIQVVQLVSYHFFKVKNSFKNQVKEYSD
jgi:hypothetical protein